MTGERLLRRALVPCLLAVATALPDAALGQPAPAKGAAETRPVRDALDVSGGGACVEPGALADLVTKWLRTDQVDSRVRVRVARDAPPSSGVSFWVWRGEQPIGERHFSAADASCPELSSALALAIALAIDATILDPEPRATATAPPAALPPVPAPAPRPPPAVPRPPRVALWSGAGSLLSSGRFGPALSVGVGGFLRLVQPLTLEADLFVTPFASPVRASGGRARIGVSGARALLLVEPWPRSRLSPAVGVGAGPLVAWGEGEGQAGAVVLRDRTAVTLVVGRARLAARATRRWLVLVAADVGYTSPELQIRRDGVPSSALLRPLVGLHAGLGATFP